MNLDFHQKFQDVIRKMEESGKDYADKKAISWQSQELKYAMISEQMKLSSASSVAMREIEAKASPAYQTYLAETAEAIRQENIAKAVYEKWRASFEAIRSLSSLEKQTMYLESGNH